MVCLRRVFALVLTIYAVELHAQVEVIKTPFSWLNVKNDRRYIEDHTRDVTARVFSINKFSRYVIGASGNERLIYSSNDNLGLGIGANWRFIGINLAFRMPLVNNDYSRFGRTRSFDVQSFLYFRKLQVDIYAQAYKGFYIPNRSDLQRELLEAYPHRADLKTRNYGLNAQYIFNNRRFSYRAAFVQNEYQKKSAGSFLLGGSLYYFRALADSALIAADMVHDGAFWDRKFNRSNIISLSVNGGYAYTLVIKKHFFATGSLAAGPGLNYTQYKDKATSVRDKGLNYQLNGTLRAAIGYNSSRYFAGLQYIRLLNKNGMPEAGAFQQFETGSFRVTLVRRFKLNRKTEKQMLEMVEMVKDDIEEVIR
jgi:hypothetical protein